MMAFIIILHVVIIVKMMFKVNAQTRITNILAYTDNENKHLVNMACRKGEKEKENI